MKRVLFLLTIVVFIVALAFPVGCASKAGDSITQGAQGIQGEQGIPGIQGPKGDPGIQGPKGEKGDKGDKGAKGDRGPSGGGGFTGATGAKGDPGPKGDTGDPGAKGDKGDPGEQGPPGTFPYAMQMGACDIYFAGTITTGGTEGYDQASQVVNFSPSFASVPFVFVTVTRDAGGPHAASVALWDVAATRISASGFTVKIGSDAPVGCTVTVHWLAISP